MAVLLFVVNMLLARRCGAWMFLWGAVSFFMPVVATPVLLYWNLSE